MKKESAISNMVFEVINKDGNTVMNTGHIQCIPTKSEITSMQKNGYKFKIDGKMATKKKIDELLKDRRW